MASFLTNRIKSDRKKREQEKVNKLEVYYFVRRILGRCRSSMFEFKTTNRKSTIVKTMYTASLLHYII
jgi:hypothetical protein